MNERSDTEAQAAQPEHPGGELVLVTGGAGFIGSHVVEELVARGEHVRVVDNLLTGRRENVQPFEGDVEFVEADLSLPEVARAACDGVGVVFHLAALPSVPVSMARPLETTRHGIVATANVLVAAKDAGARRAVFSSSSSVYGGEGQFPQREDSPPRPKSPYAATKLCCETYCRAFSEAFGLDTVCLRYFNVYGPRQPLAGPYSAVFPAFITRMLRGERPVVYGDGRQSRDFTFGADGGRANLLAAARPEPFAGESINVAAGRSVDLLELVGRINRRLGTALDPEFAPERPGDVRWSSADVTRARDLLGFRAEVDLDEGLARTIEFFSA